MKNLIVSGGTEQNIIWNSTSGFNSNHSGNAWYNHTTKKLTPIMAQLNRNK